MLVLVLTVLWEALVQGSITLVLVQLLEQITLTVTRSTPVQTLILPGKKQLVLISVSTSACSIAVLQDQSIILAQKQKTSYCKKNCHVVMEPILFLLTLVKQVPTVWNSL